VSVSLVAYGHDMLKLRMLKILSRHNFLVTNNLMHFVAHVGNVT